MVETAGTVGACGCPSEIVDTCLLCFDDAVLMFRTAIPNVPGPEGKHPGGGLALGATAEVTPPGKAKGEAWTATARATTAREDLMLTGTVMRLWCVEEDYTRGTQGWSGLQVNEGSVSR
jgi:hypothetical protein